MKNKLLALLASIGLVSSASAIEINENLSINGFIDGSYFDGDTAAGDKSFNLDEIEVNIEANVGNVSGFLEHRQVIQQVKVSISSKLISHMLLIMVLALHSVSMVQHLV